MTWSTGEILGAVFLLAVPVIAIVGGIWRTARGVSARRSIRARERARDESRRPMPSTIAVEGRVVAAADPVLVVTRRQHGCLGGPIVHVVPAFGLELDDGTRRRVEVGPDPVIEHRELLAAAPARPSAFPPPTGAPDAVQVLDGRVRVAGLQEHRDGVLAPPASCSAVLTVLGATSGEG